MRGHGQMKGQLKLKMPKERKLARLTVKLDTDDIHAMTRGMNIVGETNMSSYIRRLIHENKDRGLR